MTDTLPGDAGLEAAKLRSRKRLAGIGGAAVVVCGSLGIALGLTAAHRGGAAAYGTPAGRSAEALAYDGTTKTVVMFGGRAADGSALGDTWTWDGNGWTQQHPAHSPGARLNALIGFDPASGDVVLSGGASTKAETAPVPQPCYAPGGAGTGAPGKATGANTTSVPIAPPPCGNPGPGTTTTYFVTTSLSDSWVWNGSDWSPAGKAVTLENAGTDTATGHLYAFGYSYAVTPGVSGGGSGGAASGSGTASTGTIYPACVTGTAGPGAGRPVATCPPEPTSSAVHSIPPVPSNASTTYEWRGGWQPITAAGSAPSAFTLLVTDPVSGHLADFTQRFSPCPLTGAPQRSGGGAPDIAYPCYPCGPPIENNVPDGGASPAIACPATGCATCNCSARCPAVWSGPAVTESLFDGHQWTTLTPATSATFPAGLTTMPGNHGVTTESGDAIGLDESGRTWRWTGGTSAWTELKPLSSPPAGSEFSLAYDAAAHETVLFGGTGRPTGKATTLPGPSAATWLWDGTTWKEAGTATPAPAETPSPTPAPSATPVPSPSPTGGPTACPLATGIRPLPATTAAPDETPVPAGTPVPTTGPGPSCPPLPTAPPCPPNADCAVPGGGGGAGVTPASAPQEGVSGGGPGQGVAGQPSN